MNLFQAMYGYPPPTTEMALPKTVTIATIRELLYKREELNNNLKK